jgi:transcriptional regulator with XRE-family HTH domain
MAQSPMLVAFGRAVRRQRRDRDFTLEELGLRASLSARHLGEIERGNVDLRFSTMASLANAMDMLPGELVAKGDEESGRHHKNG